MVGEPLKYYIFFKRSVLLTITKCQDSPTAQSRLNLGLRCLALTSTILLSYITASYTIYLERHITQSQACMQ